VDLNRKVDGYVALIRERTLRAAARKQAMERLAKRVRADENAARRLKNRLHWFMKNRGLDKIETKRYRVALCANGGKLPLEVSVGPEELPEESQHAVTTVTVDHKALRQALDAGREVPGVKLGECGTHLRIS
jgi:hypothetical protein